MGFRVVSHDDGRLLVAELVVDGDCTVEGLVEMNGALGRCTSGRLLMGTAALQVESAGRALGCDEEAKRYGDHQGGRPNVSFSGEAKVTLAQNGGTLDGVHVGRVSYVRPKYWVVVVVVVVDDFARALSGI
jgi:hypothetical protein